MKYKNKQECLPESFNKFYESYINHGPIFLPILQFFGETTTRKRRMVKFDKRIGYYCENCSDQGDCLRLTSRESPLV